MNLSEKCFKRDIILDPFCGSGTTLVQSAELGIDSIGIDIQAFNAMISNVKVDNHNIPAISNELNKITEKLKAFVDGKSYIKFEEKLLSELSSYNNTFFPTWITVLTFRQGIIKENDYSIAKEAEFLKIFNNLVKKI